MIRINLLGGPKPKRGRRPVVAARVSLGEGPSVLMVGVLVFAIALAGNGLWFWKLKHDAVKIQNDIEAAEARITHLQQVKALYEEREKQRQQYAKRLDVIHQLQKNQMGPSTLLNMVAGTVNKSDEVWLSSVNDEATAVKFKGVALSVHAVAAFMRNLQNTGQFKSVEIKSSFQDEQVKDMQAFVFELTCEKQPQTPPSTAAQAQPAKKS